MTISENIELLEVKISLQKGLLKSSSSDGAKMRCLMTIEDYRTRISELKTL